MARRTKRRGTTPPRKRSGAPQSSQAVPARAATPVSSEPVSAEHGLPKPPVPASPNDEPRLSAPVPGLPRRTAPAAPEGPSAEGPPTAAPSESLLPKRARIAGRAELRRRQEANLEPLDDSPAVPLDRTPYLRLDVRRVMWVSLGMLALVIVGLIFIH